MSCEIGLSLMRTMLTADLVAAEEVARTRLELVFLEEMAGDGEKEDDGTELGASRDGE